VAGMSGVYYEPSGEANVIYSSKYIVIRDKKPVGLKASKFYFAPGRKIVYLYRFRYTPTGALAQFHYYEQYDDVLHEIDVHEIEYIDDEPTKLRLQKFVQHRERPAPILGMTFTGAMTPASVGEYTQVWKDNRRWRCGDIFSAPYGITKSQWGRISNFFCIVKIVNLGRMTAVMVSPVWRWPGDFLHSTIGPSSTIPLLDSIKWEGKAPSATGVSAPGFHCIIRKVMAFDERSLKAAERHRHPSIQSKYLFDPDANTMAMLPKPYD
jgi:hypothetical protein